MAKKRNGTVCLSYPIQNKTTIMVLSFAQTNDEADIHALLQAANLPTADLTTEHLQHFMVMQNGEEIVGVAGVERVSPHRGLLRSLTVDASYRGQGIAKRLYEAVENHACAMGMREVFALTTTIEPWLTRLGYERVERGNVPDDIRQTREFSGLCAETAAVMRKTLRVPSEILPAVYECA
jgi:amino-acid N-acetyltransferase